MRKMVGQAPPYTDCEETFVMKLEIIVGGMVILALLGATNATAQDRWLHALCKPLECTINGTFVQSDDGTLMAVQKNVLVTSTDGGKTWTPISEPICPGMDLSHVGHVGQFARTKDGAIVIIYLNFEGYKWSWDNEKQGPNPDCRLEMWCIRSTDGGKTWTDKQQLLDGYNADFMGFIQTSTGRLVATMEHLIPDLRRWVSCSFVSDDEGKTWKRSNWIDLGGHGHHDGAVEPTMTELSDGRLLMLIRTSLGQFWKAYSDDGGRYWRTIQPSGLDASSAPGWLTRLKSGRLVFVWNRKDSESKGEWPKTNGPGPTYEYPASNQREELSIAFSDDDGETWNKPIVVARQPGGQLAYPYILEREPGVLWVMTRYTWYGGGKAAPPLMVELREADLVGKQSGG
jgi:sialidase-1